MISTVTQWQLLLNQGTSSASCAMPIIAGGTGWPAGRHYANVRKISGIDSNGWDVVDDYQQIIIEVL